MATPPSDGIPVATSDLRDQLQAALGTQYTVGREIGRGGMATVYLAEDTKHHRSVALKVLHAELASHLGSERFRREISVAAKLQHPHILAVHDSGESATGLLWFTMPYVEGESLRDRLRRETQLSVDEAVRITRGLAGALDYAHHHGVIHRDIKPENVLLTRQGEALLADFGIARALGSDADGSETGRSSLTGTGLTVGTPQYMSPEQASADRELTARSDVYSLGVVLYEMLAGEPPFTGPSPQVVLAKMLSGEVPSVRRSRPKVPEPIDAALRKALAPVPADRWASAGDFARALESAERTGPATPAAARRSRGIPVAALTLALGVFIGGGVLFAWREHNTRSGTASSGPIRLAVLPFDNIGDSADAYFADGVTDAVRSKLTAISGLEVIASASSGQYRHTSKSPRQIGQELGVRYLLVGKVRWAKTQGAPSRVQVSPELIETTSATDTWSAPFDAPLTDVFQVQTAIAGDVAEQLEVALSPATRQTLAQRPTENLDAYDAYLRGLDIERRGSARQEERRAGAAYREAVERDSTFVLAWVGIADTHAALYGLGVASPGVADTARAAALKAIALAPDLPEAHSALGHYYRLVQGDVTQALAEYAAALAHSPNNVRALGGAAMTERSLGRWRAAELHLQQAERLDPHDARTAALLGEVETFRRNYPAAQVACDRALSLQPRDLDFIHSRAMVALLQGDLGGARSIMQAALARTDTMALVAFFADRGDLVWVLDSAQQRVLLRLGPAAYDNDRATWAFVLAQHYYLHGETNRARAYADTARAAFEAGLKVRPNDPERHALLGVALAYMGHKAEAASEGQHAVALLPISKNASDGPYIQQQLVRIYTVVGEPEKALDALEPLLKIPDLLSPSWLKIDPTFAPLHGNPRFQALISQPATSPID
jgi:eukaryotic-like serine/threonine-protein kinase